MSEVTKSKESQVKQNLILVGNFILKNCIYRGKTHNLYLGISVEIEQSRTILCHQTGNVNIHYMQANTNVEKYQEEERILKKISEIPLIPKVLSSGDVRLQNTNYFYWVFDKQGPSLKICFQFMHCQFTLPTVCILAIQLLNLLEKLHSQFIVHRNIKPKKILTSPTGQKNELMLIDFRHAVKYKHKNGKYLASNSKYANAAHFTKFTSINQHLGLAPSPKDDLESLGFMIIYFLKRGDMFKIKDEGSKQKKMEEMKLRMIPEKFCKDLPLEILQYFQYVRMTNIAQYPLSDYEFLKKMFRSILLQMNVNEKDFQYDWVLKLQKPQSQSQFQQSTQTQLQQQQEKARIFVHQPQKLEGIPEVQTEQERASLKNSLKASLKASLIKQLSTVQFSDDEEDIQQLSVCEKMTQLPTMQEFIRLKN